MATCTSYPSDVCDWEWAVAVPYLSLLAPPALQRKYELRAVFNAGRYLAHTGAPWRYLPSDFAPWAVVESASPSGDGGGELRGAGPGCAAAAARHEGQNAAAQRGDRGRAGAALDAGEREPGALQRGQTTQRIEGAYRGRYPWP